MTQQIKEIWVIRKKGTDELWETGKSKRSWRAAHRIWRNNNERVDISFNDQDIYEVVQLNDLTDYKSKYDALVRELQEIYIPDSLGCGLEDLGIYSRYQGAEYGYQECINRVEEVISAHRS